MKNYLVYVTKDFKLNKKNINKNFYFTKKLILLKSFNPSSKLLIKKSSLVLMLIMIFVLFAINSHEVSKKVICHKKTDLNNEFYYKLEITAHPKCKWSYHLTGFPATPERFSLKFDSSNSVSATNSNSNISDLKIQIPLYVQIRFFFTSTDPEFNHIWSVPELGIKGECVANKISEITLTITELGSFAVYCETCSILEPLPTKLVVILGEIKELFSQKSPRIT